jgi:urease accessory protein
MRGTTILPAGSWDPLRESDRIRAEYDQRHRRRILLRTEGGRELLLDLPHAQHLRDGDAIACDDGSLVRIISVPEQLLEISAASPVALMRLAWHLGNRHLPAAIAADRLLIREDHVIAEMVRGLGGTVRAILAPFDPETGAYNDDGHGHGH